jgi:hypothetical protein
MFLLLFKEEYSLMVPSGREVVRYFDKPKKG